MGGQVYLDFLSLSHKADLLFNFSTISSGGVEGLLPEQQELPLSEDTLKEIHNQLFNLSSRLKEFDTKTPKKLICCLHISKLILKYFNIFNELGSGSNGLLAATPRSRGLDQQLMGSDDDEADEDEEQEREEARRATVLTKQIVDKAERLTESVPDQDVIGTMLLKKSKYMHDFLSRKSRF
jgi:hypothetical protein